MSPRERLFALEQFGIKLGLDNITHLLDALGRPERAFKSVHVAGTNGKGSVTAMVERGLRAAGYRTGRYTSPHLSRIEERIAIDGVPVDAETFDTVAAEVMTLVDRLQHERVLDAPPTFFEATTAMAFEIFRRAGVSVAAVEVGLGGRFDSTNVITPEVSVITSIAFDHERHLGSTLTQIAFEKAGIIKPGVPVVVGELPPDALAVVEQTAAERGASVIHARAEQMDVVSRTPAMRVVIRTPRATYDIARLALAGIHQARNAVVAVRALEACAERGIDVHAEAIVAALADVSWPARLEWLHLSGDRSVLLDAAHNPDGAAACAAYLHDAGVAPLPLVLAVMRDKDAAGIVRPLAGAASVIVATQAESPRSLRADELAARVRADHDGLAVEVCADPRAAVDRALGHSARAAIAGSIFLVGPLREHLLRHGARSAGGL